MPIQVRSTWQEKTDRVTVSFDGESATIDFYINQITPAMVQQVSGSADLDTLTRALSQLIARWDVLGAPAITEAGIVQALGGDANFPAAPQPTSGMYPTDPASLAQLPLAFLSLVTEAIFGSIAPKSQRAGKA